MSDSLNSSQAANLLFKEFFYGRDLEVQKELAKKCICDAIQIAEDCYSDNVTTIDDAKNTTANPLPTAEHIKELAAGYVADMLEEYKAELLTKIKTMNFEYTANVRPKLSRHSQID